MIGDREDPQADSLEAVPPAVLRPIWDGAGKPLLRIGRGGVQVGTLPAPHLSSLLLQLYVKVHWA